MSDVRVIDRDEAVALLRKQVEAVGEDYVYTEHFDECVLAYKDADGPAPACIVGRVYADLGVPVDDLLRMDDVVGHEAWYTNDDGSNHMVGEKVDFKEFGLDFTLGAVSVLRAPQKWQDAGTSWVDAVRTAASL